MIGVDFSSNWLVRLHDNWRAGITNQGIQVSSFQYTMSRQRQRREGFARRVKQLNSEFGFNLPRKQRRRIAWDSWRG